MLAVLAGLVVAGCEDKAKKLEAEPAQVHATAASPVSAQEVAPAAASGKVAGSAEAEKSCSPGGCAPGQCGANK